MPNSSSPTPSLRVALVVAAWSGSDPSTTNKHLIESFIPRLMARNVPTVQVFVYVHCDKARGRAVIPARTSEFMPFWLVRNKPKGRLRPAGCGGLMSNGKAWNDSVCGHTLATNWTQCSIEWLGNIGREAHIYLHHLVRVYADPNVADVTYFVQEGEGLGLGSLLECASGLSHHHCTDVLVGPLRRPEAALFYSPVAMRLADGLNKSDPRIPDRHSFLWNGVLEPLLRACHIKEHGVQLPLHRALSGNGTASAWWVAGLQDHENCSRPGHPRWQGRKQGDGAAADELTLPATPLHDHVANTLVRHLQPSVCRAVTTMLSAVNCYRLPSRGAFALHVDGIQQMPFSLLVELYALSSSQDVVVSPGRRLTPCSAACWRPEPISTRSTSTLPASSAALNCGAWVLAGDALAYILESLWPILFNALTQECTSIDGSCVPRSDPRKGGLWCPRAHGS